ncbi:MAG: TlpA disulfide reductase family protein [Acidimicrobiales bacterium]
MTSPEQEHQRSTQVVWVVIGVVIIVAGIGALVLARVRSDDGSGPVPFSSSPSTSSTILPEGWLPQYDASKDRDPAVGMTIPKVTGTDADGNDITIGPDGKAKVILFVAHWCPHCQREVPLLASHLDDHPMPDDVELLTVSTSIKPGAQNYPPAEWLAREHWEAPVLQDDEASSTASKFGLSAFPYFVVVDADGKVVRRASGELSTDEFDAAVEAARTGRS